MLSAAKRTDYISIENYRNDEQKRAIKHEYLDGQIYAMAGASKNHQHVIKAILLWHSVCIKNTPCDS
jgi:Uma2 family endonuclease